MKRLILSAASLPFLFAFFVFGGDSPYAYYEHSDKDLVKKFSLPSQIKNKIDNFFQKNNLNSIASIQNVITKTSINQTSLLKKVGSGTRTVVVELPELKNFVLKIPHLNWTVSKKAEDPRWLFKSCIERENITRALRASHILKIIQDQKLKHIKAPKKFLYHIPRRPHALIDSNYIIVAEKTDYDSEKNPYKLSTKEQVLNLAKIMLHTHHKDNADGNLVIDKNGNLLLIDTDDAWIFMLKMKFLKTDELLELANFCAKKLIITSKQVPEIKNVLVFSPLQKIANKTESDNDLLRKTIMFYRDIGTIGAIHTDVSDVFSLNKKDQIDILNVMNKKWIEEISKRYPISKDSAEDLKRMLSPTNQ